MAERQQLRSQVIGLILAGHSASSAARTIGVPLTTAKRWAELFIENNEVSNRAIPGRPCISTREKDAILVREAENHPFLSAFELKMASNFPGFPLPARRRLREHGIRSHRSATKEHLKIDCIIDRPAYATIRRDFDWRNVIFSDAPSPGNLYLADREEQKRTIGSCNVKPSKGFLSYRKEVPT